MTEVSFNPHTVLTDNKYGSGKAKSAIRPVNRYWIRKHLGIDPEVCSICGKSIRCYTQYIPNKFIFENSAHGIFRMVHPKKCKKDLQDQLRKKGE